MKKMYRRKLSIHLILMFGIMLFAAGLFWESGQQPTWAQTDPGTVPPPAPTATSDHGGGARDDDDDGRPGGFPFPGGPPGPPGGGPPGDGPRGPNLADLSLRKWVDEPQPNIGQVITYTIVISNGGPRGAFAVRVLDRLPVGVVLSDAIPTRGRFYSRLGLWDIGFIRASEQLTLNLIAVVTGTGRITNTAEVRRAFPADPDSIPANRDPLEDDLNVAVITPTEVLADQVEEAPNASFIDQAQLTPPDQPPAANDVPENDQALTTEPVIEAPNLADTNASVTVVTKPVESSPLFWISLLGGGIALIAIGLWLAKR